MRVAFFGIYGYGAAAGEAIHHSSHELVGVVTKPNDPGQLQPVATWAESQGIPVMQPSDPASPDFLRWLRARKPELVAVAGYHLRLPPEILAIPERGAINAHASLLPAYRGPSAHKWVIIMGEHKTGVTVHEMTSEFDQGVILAQQAIPIENEDTGETLLRRLTPLAASLISATIEALAEGAVVPRSQDPHGGSYFSYPTESDALIDWRRPGRTIHNLIRGVTPRPGAWSVLTNDRVTIGQCRTTSERSTASPGHIIAAQGESLLVATGSDNVWIGDLRLPGIPSHGGSAFADLKPRVGYSFAPRAEALTETL